MILVIIKLSIYSMFFREITEQLKFNNIYVSKNADKKGKLFRSKQFFEDVIEKKNIEDLSKETINNFKILFQRNNDLLKLSFDLI